MVMAVKGNYRYGNSSNGFKGDFSFKVHLSEGMERDNGDYIIYHGKQDLLGLKWKEIIYKGKKVKEETDLSEKITPVIKLNYVVRSEGKIYFDIEISPESVPHDEMTRKIKLLLPRSAENQRLHWKDRYNSSVRKGSNHVIIDDIRIYQKDEAAKTFKWSWRRKKQIWMNSHTVDLKLKIFRKEG